MLVDIQFVYYKVIETHGCIFILIKISLIPVYIDAVDETSAFV